MKKLILCLLFLPLFSYSQDLYVQYFDADQTNESIKKVWVSDENGTVKENKFPAKSHIHLIKIFEERNYKVKDIKLTTELSGGIVPIVKYHLWFDKIKETEKVKE